MPSKILIVDDDNEIRFSKNFIELMLQGPAILKAQDLVWQFQKKSLNFTMGRFGLNAILIQ